MTAVDTMTTRIDRERLEQDLRKVIDVILALIPPLPPMLLRLVGMPSLDLRSAGYKSCAALAALPDRDLEVVLWVIDRECSNIAPTVVFDDHPEPTSTEIRDALAKVVAAIS